jgi:hypothetical protein
MRSRRTPLLGLLALVVALAVPATSGASVGHHDGTYLGSDSHHNEIRFTARGNLVVDFKIGGHVRLHQGHLSHGEFNTAQNGITFHGWWLDSVSVEGVYRYHRNHRLITVSWTAHAFST